MLMDSIAHWPALLDIWWLSIGSTSLSSWNPLFPQLERVQCLPAPLDRSGVICPQLEQEQWLPALLDRSGGFPLQMLIGLMPLPCKAVSPFVGLPCSAFEGIGWCHLPCSWTVLHTGLPCSTSGGLALEAHLLMIANGYTTWAALKPFADLLLELVSPALQE